MTAYQRARAQFSALGVAIVAISVDSAAVTRTLQRELELDFALLCDTERELITAWSLLNRVERGGIAFPAVFVLDPDGAIVFRSLDRLVTRVNPEPVLAFIDQWTADPTRRGETAERVVQRPGIKDATLAYVRKWFGDR